MGAAILRCSNVFCVLWWTRVSRKCFGIIRVLENYCDMYVFGVAHWGVVGGNGLLYMFIVTYVTISTKQ
jgi:hypothetical protein